MLFGLALPLVDVLSYPERLSVLGSLQVDAETYHRLASDLSAGAPLGSIPPLQPPGFVAALSVVYRVFGRSPIVAKLLLWACLVASAWLAGRLARRVWGPNSGVVAAALVATEPALRHYAGTVQYEMFVAAWFLSLLAGIDLVTRSTRIVSSTLGIATAGVSGGLLVLTRELRRASSAPGAVGCRQGGQPNPSCWRGGAWGPVPRHERSPGRRMVGLSIVANGPNGVISDKGPVTFRMGFNPRASGTYDSTEIEEPSGVAFVQARPYEAMRLAVRKVGYFSGLLHDVWNVPRPVPLWIHRASLGLVPLEWIQPLARGGWLLAPFVAAALMSVRRRTLAGWWILPMSVVCWCGAFALTLSSYRFAVPILPVMFVWCAGPVTEVVYRAWTWTFARTARVCWAGLIVTVAVAAQWGPWPTEIAFRAVDTYAMNASNRRDPTTGRAVRLVAAADGPRTAMVLADEYLPAGAFQLLLTMSRRPVHRHPMQTLHA